MRKSKTIFLKKLELKYNLPEDLLLLAWILKHPSKILPVAGTVNIARIQSLMKAVPGLRATIQMLPNDVEAHFDDPKDSA